VSAEKTRSSIKKKKELDKGRNCRSGELNKITRRLGILLLRRIIKIDISEKEEN